MSWVVAGGALLIAVVAIVWARRQVSGVITAAMTADARDAAARDAAATSAVPPAVVPSSPRPSTIPPPRNPTGPRAAITTPPPAADPGSQRTARVARPSRPPGDTRDGEALAWIANLAEEVARGATLPAEPPATVPPAGAAAFDALGRIATRMDEMTKARSHIVATERDLERARKMYRSILPLASLGRHGQMRLAGVSTPANETGGDWWTYRKLSGERLLVAVGDATGHGVYSAMIGCAAHGAVEALSLVGEERMTPRALLDAISAAIRVPGADHAAMTCFAALFDPGGTVSFANASHMLPLLCATDASGAVVKVSALVPASQRALEDDSDVFSSEITEGQHRLAPGELVLLMTDGLPERRDRAGRSFGHRRLQQVLTQLTYSGGTEALTAFRDAILAEVDRFADGVPADDDITLVICARDRA